MDNDELLIDPRKLDEELMKQPILYKTAAEVVEERTRERDTAKISLDSTEAATGIQILSSPTDFGLKEKPTVGSINDAKVLDKHIQKAKNFLNTTSLRLLQAQNFLKAVEMKKKALEGLVQLYNGQYFSVPDAGKPIEGGKRKLKEKISEKNQRSGLRSKSQTDEKKIAAMSEKGREALKEHLDEEPKKILRRKK